MTTGLIFDIKEFAINDGPGIRLTVFMKGCPLRCAWCHNPEGISPQPQLNRKTGCMVGKEYTVEELARRICKFRDVFDLSGGGVTFSGGEPTRQPEFVEACALRLNGIHKTLDTSGFCPSATFRRLLGVFDLVYYDLKLADTAAHQRFTGRSNLQILENLHILDESGVPYHIRIPLIPEITDTEKKSVRTFRYPCRPPQQTAARRPAALQHPCRRQIRFVRDGLSASKRISRKQSGQHCPF